MDRQWNLLILRRDSQPEAEIRPVERPEGINEQAYDELMLQTVNSVRQELGKIGISYKVASFKSDRLTADEQSALLV